MTVYSNVQECFVTINGIEAHLSTSALNSLDERAQQAFPQAMLLGGRSKKGLTNPNL